MEIGKKSVQKIKCSMWELEFTLFCWIKISKIGDDDNNDKHSEWQENSSKEISERKKYKKKIREQKFNAWVTADLKGDTQVKWKKQP